MGLDNIRNSSRQFNRSFQTIYVLEAVGWVRANSVAACTKPSVSKKRKSDELLILPEMNEEQRQQLLKVHEERQRKLELQRLTQIEESRHKMKRNIPIG